MQDTNKRVFLWKTPIKQTPFRGKQIKDTSYTGHPINWLLIQDTN